MNSFMVLRISLKVAFLVLAFMVITFISLLTLAPFSYVIALWLLSFLVAGAYVLKSFNSSEEIFTKVLVSDILISLFLISGVIFLLALNAYLRARSAFDFLGGLSIYLLFGPPVLVSTIILGSLAYYFYKTEARG